LNQTDIDKQWQALCDEHDEAKKRYFDASALVTKKFSAVFKDPLSPNPTADELDMCDSAEQEWNSVKQRMKEFCSKHA
jgi:hypothetical protein